MQAPYRPPFQIARGWTSPGITDTSQELVPFAWRGFTVPQRAAELGRSWYRQIPQVMVAAPVGARSGGLGIAPVQSLRSWTQNLLETTLQPVVGTPFFNANPPAFTPPWPAAMYGWAQEPPLPLTQVAAVVYTFRAPMQAPIARHYNRDLASMSFECALYIDEAPPTSFELREPMQAPRRIAEPYRMPQGWDQETPLALRFTITTLRAPMEAPSFNQQILSWRQAWNPNNLLPLQGTITVNPRYHVIGSFIVRRYL